MPTPRETIANAARMVGSGRPDLAAEELRRATRSHPSDPDLHHELGIVCLQSGQSDQALYHLERAAALAPKRADIHTNFATTLNIRGRVADAADAYKRAVAIDPASFPAQLGLSSALAGTHHYDAALDAAIAAIELAPSRAESYVNQALALSRLGRSAEAVEALRSAITRIGDHPLLLTSLCNLLITRPETTPEDLLSWHERLGRMLASFAASFTPVFPDTTPGRRLRIGYLSPDFRDHAVAHFIAPILQHHDRARVEVHVYASVAAPDAITQSLSRLADHWTEVAYMGDAPLAQRIRRDGIDVLVDLSGYNPGSRLSVLAHRPAPVQVEYLGYPATTGLRAVHQRLTDSRLDPDGAERLYVESLLRLDAPCLAYAPGGAGASPAPHIPPRDADEPAIFLSLAPTQRINESVLDAWAAILKAVPGSRLLLKTASFSEEPARAAFRSLLSSRGVEPSRLDFSGFDRTRADYLSAIAAADLALDTFPAAGLASTCDALSVGVPVVTLAGRTHAGRLGVGLLSAAGCEELIARSTDDYVRLATDLARNRQRLAKYRVSLPAQLAASPLCDGASLTRRLEDAYQRLWKEASSSVYYAAPPEGLAPDVPPTAAAEPPAAPRELPTISPSDLV